MPVGGMREDATGRTVTAHESREIPWLSVLFGYGPMLPIVAGAALAWWTRGRLDYLVALLTMVYAGAILVFLAGARRGVSFRTGDSPTAAQIATVLLLFGLGLGGLMSAVLGKAVLALALLIAGYVAVGVLDPIAARRGEAPLFFARLRPTQMPIGVAGLAALLALKWMSPY